MNQVFSLQTQTVIKSIEVIDFSTTFSFSIMIQVFPVLWNPSTKLKEIHKHSLAFLKNTHTFLMFSTEFANSGNSECPHGR